VLGVCEHPDGCRYVTNPGCEMNGSSMMPDSTETSEGIIAARIFLIALALFIVIQMIIKKKVRNS
jgi:hypothetical protein